MRTDSTDSPDWLQILLSISVFTFQFFCCFHILVVGSVLSINLTHVIFWTHVKIASRIESYIRVRFELRLHWSTNMATLATVAMTCYNFRLAGRARELRASLRRLTPTSNCCLRIGCRSGNRICQHQQPSHGQDAQSIVHPVINIPSSPTEAFVLPNRLTARDSVLFTPCIPSFIHQNSPGQPHYYYRPCYPTARLRSPSSYVVSDEPFPERSRPCRANLHKWGLAESPSCDCGQRQTMNHIVDTCPLTHIWRWTESTPRSGWWRSHMAGIYSDCSTREIIVRQNW